MSWASVPTDAPVNQTDLNDGITNDSLPCVQYPTPTDEVLDWDDLQLACKLPSGSPTGGVIPSKAEFEAEIVRTPESFDATHDTGNGCPPDGLGQTVVDLSWSNAGISSTKTLQWRDDPGGAWSNLDTNVGTAVEAFEHTTATEGQTNYYRIKFNDTEFTEWVETQVLAVCPI